MNTALGEEATRGAGSGSETLTFLQGGDFSSVFWQLMSFPPPWRWLMSPQFRPTKPTNLPDSHIPTSAHTQPQRFNS